MESDSNNALQVTMHFPADRVLSFDEFRELFKKQLTPTPTDAAAAAAAASASAVKKSPTSVSGGAAEGAGAAAAAAVTQPPGGGAAGPGAAASPVSPAAAPRAFDFRNVMAAAEERRRANGGDGAGGGPVPLGAPADDDGVQNHRRERNIAEVFGNLPRVRAFPPMEQQLNPPNPNPWFRAAAPPPRADAAAPNRGGNNNNDRGMFQRLFGGDMDLNNNNNNRVGMGDLGGGARDGDRNAPAQRRQAAAQQLFDFVAANFHTFVLFGISYAIFGGTVVAIAAAFGVVRLLLRRVDFRVARNGDAAQLLQQQQQAMREALQRRPRGAVAKLMRRLSLAVVTFFVSLWPGWRVEVLLAELEAEGLAL
jgi:hypothetical protein